MGGGGGRVEGFLGSEKWAQLAAPVIPSQSPVGLGPLPLPLPQTICLLCSNYKPSGPRRQTGAERRRRRDGDICNNSSYERGKIKTAFSCQPGVNGSERQKNKQVAAAAAIPASQSRTGSGFLNELTSALKTEHGCYVLFSNDAHISLVRVKKPKSVLGQKENTGWNTPSHFQHSRSHLMHPVLEWQSLLPLDKVYPFLFEMKMSVISFEIDDSFPRRPNK